MNSMTIDEAIEILQEEHDWSQEKSYVIKALEMAITALKEISQEQVRKGEWIRMSDDDGCTWFEYGLVFNAKAATEAADLIERLAEAGESGPAGWISVKERLPEEDVPVLVCYIGAADSIKEGKHCTDGIANYYRGAWYWWEAYGASNDEPVAVKITHWMPLLEPPGDSDAHA